MNIPEKAGLLLFIFEAGFAPMQESLIMKTITICGLILGMALFLFGGIFKKK